LRAFKFNEASSSDYPPDKNIIPTQAGKIDLDNATAVLKAISYGVAFALSGLVDPGVTIFGLYNIPSKNKLFSTRAALTA
jgi:hypothetical protein